jgi:hypothetical protein
MKFVKGDAIAGLIIVAVNLLGGILIGTDAWHVGRPRRADLLDPDHRRRPDRADPGAVHRHLRRHHRHPRDHRRGAEQRRPRHRPAGAGAAQGADDRRRHRARPGSHSRHAGGRCSWRWRWPSAASATLLARGTRQGGGREPAARSPKCRRCRPPAAPHPSARLATGRRVRAHRALADGRGRAAAAGLRRRGAERRTAEDPARPVLRPGRAFPGIALRFNDALPDETYNILLSEVPVSQGRLRPQHLLARETPAHLEALGISFETDRKFCPTCRRSGWPIQPAGHAVAGRHRDARTPARC